MKVLIGTCFESNEELVKFVKEICKSLKYEVKIYTSDFSHIKKTKRKAFPIGFDKIDTLPYKRNLSLKRMYSHHKFANDLFEKIEEYDPDLIYLFAPANSLIKKADEYKKKHPDKKIIIHIIDMWPESLPIKFNKDIFPFNIWKNLRSKYLNSADYLISECDFYRQILEKEYQGKIETIFWSRKNKAIKEDLNIDDSKLSLLYLGSINNIIDIDEIYRIIESINYPVTLHIVGEGEKSTYFVEKLNKICEVIYHGPIREEKKKKEIFDLCHAGINIYKKNLYIGLTTKCIDYFEHGLPIINNIKADTYKMVEDYNVGINIDEDTNIDYKELINMRSNNQNIIDLYNNSFTFEVFKGKLIKVFNEVNSK